MSHDDHNNARRIAELEEQVKELVRTEQRLHLVQYRLDEQARLYRELHSVGRQLLTTSDAEKLRSIATRFATEVLGFERCVYCLYDSENNTYTPHCWEGYHDQESQQRLSQVRIPANCQCLESLSSSRADAFAIGRCDNVCKFLEVAEWLACPLGHKWPARLGLLFTGNSEGRKDYYTPIVMGSEQAMGFISLASQTAAALELTHEREMLEERVAQRTKELESASHAKSTFLATMSHEIRTPMNAILGFTQLLAKTPLSEDQQEFVTTIQRSGRSLLSLLNDVLDFSKIEAGELTLFEHKFTIRELMDLAIEHVLPAAQEKGIELAAVVSRHVASSYMGDEGRLRQIFVNLLGNAVKFTESGSVVVAVNLDNEDDPANLTFTVVDTGKGIPSAEIAKLFEPFVQLESEPSRRYGGTGLGLAISRRLVNAMGGTLTAASEENVGSAFTVNLTLTPLLPTNPLRPPRFTAFVIAPEGPTVSSLEEMLAKMSFASTVSTSFSHFPEETPDVVIWDDRVALKEEDLTALTRGQAPLLFLSSSKEEDKLIEPQSFLKKPVTWRRFRKTLAEIVIKKTMERKTTPQKDHTFSQGKQELSILIAEDNEINRLMLQLMLSHWGFSADKAVDGEQALKAMISNSYDLVLMDLHMPKMSGLDVTQTYKKSAPFSSTKIVAVTADVRLSMRQTCEKCGMHGFITKPIDEKALRSVIEDALRDKLKLAD